MIHPVLVLCFLYMIVNAPCADDATHEEAAAETGKAPSMEYG